MCKCLLTMYTYKNKKKILEKNHHMYLYITNYICTYTVNLQTGVSDMTCERGLLFDPLRGLISSSDSSSSPHTIRGDSSSGDNFLDLLSLRGLAVGGALFVRRGEVVYAGSREDGGWYVLRENCSRIRGSPLV